MLCSDGFFYSTLPTLSNWNALTEQQSRAICGFFVSSPISLPLSKPSLPTQRVTQTHFALPSNDRTFRLPISFPVSGLARPGMKPRLCRSSFRAFASTRPLMLFPTCSIEVLFACPPFPSWNLLPSLWNPPFSPHAPALNPLSRQSAALHLFNSLPHHDLVIQSDVTVPFPFCKDSSGVLANCSFCATEATFSFLAGPVCSSFSAKVCAIRQALHWSRQQQKV